jgi:hypothetical protein
MDSGLTLTSPFAPPAPPLNLPLDVPAAPALLPTALEFIAALRTTMTAFHEFARTHLLYTQQTTVDRLNLYGIPATFQLEDKVKTYVPPTHVQMRKTGRHAKHIIA